MTENFQIENGTLTVTQGTEYLESEKFSENPEIIKVILPEGLKHISVACFNSCENLKEINIPSTVKTIDDGAFLFCKGLESVTLPHGLEEIADLSFQGSGLRTITIPKTVKRIGEEAFFECENLIEANVLGEDTVLLDDAFGSDYNLIKGYIAPGFPQTAGPGTELLYSLLWASCSDRHGEMTSARAKAFIRENEMLVMERILKFNNVAAMTGIAKNHLLDIHRIDDYVKMANESGLTELTALLIKCKGEDRHLEDDFDL